MTVYLGSLLLANPDSVVPVIESSSELVIKKKELGTMASSWHHFAILMACAALRQANLVPPPVFRPGMNVSGVHATGSTVHLLVNINYNSTRQLSWRVIPDCACVFHYNKSQHIVSGCNVPLPEHNGTCQEVMFTNVTGSPPSYTWRISWLNATRVTTNTTITWITNPSGNRLLTPPLVVKDCDELIGDGLRVNFNGYARFQTDGNFTCSRNAAQLFYPRNSSQARDKTKCNAVAEWEESEAVQCWFAPNMTLNYTIDKTVSWVNSSWNTSKMDTLNLRVGDILTLKCYIQNDGKPPVKELILFFEGQSDNRRIQLNMSVPFLGYTMGEKNISVESSHHMGVFRCKGVSNFTEVISDEGFSESLQRLNVFFAPEIISCLRDEQNGRENVTITFKSNPPVHAVDLLVDGGSEPMLSIGSSNPQQKYFLPNVSKSFLHQEGVGDMKILSLRMDFNGKRTARNVTCIPSISDHATTVDPSTGHGNQTSNPLTEQTKLIIIISASAATGTLMIILIVLVWKRSKGVKREEVVNPIYDTTNMSAVGEGSSSDARKSKNSEKVERGNPLYGTTAEATYAPIIKKKKPKKDSSAEIPEATGNETYATVVKPKKEKKKGSANGQSNDAFSGEGDTTYAAVNKKKKRADKSEDEPSTSGLGNNAQVSQECTYAAVQKKGKRKPKDDDEDLHGSSK